ncbi:hypothetical protein D9M68_18570 [compost metagenome]
MQQSTMLLDVGTDGINSVQGHDAEISLQIAHSEGFTEDELWECLVDDPLPIETGWPKRQLPDHKWLPSAQNRSASVADIYAHLKPKKIGYVSVHGFVKVNDLWVLHGRISYIGGHLLNHAALQPMRLIVHTKDIDRTDRASGRILVNIVKVRTDPL